MDIARLLYDSILFLEPWELVLGWLAESVGFYRLSQPLESSKHILIN